MAQIYGRTLTGMKIFDQEAFKDPNWEYVTGVTGSPASYKLDGSASVPMSLLRAKGITTPAAAWASSARPITDGFSEEQLIRRGQHSPG